MLVLANILQPLIDAFDWVLVFLHDTFGVGWGVSIILLTVLVRMLLLPLAIKQFRSMQSLARHQPELKRLQEKYKGDKDRMNQEMMKFYRENKINPLASCLPLLAQIPVFISLFYMLQKDLRLDICPGINPPGTSNPDPCGSGGPAEFLFIPDLTDKATGGVLITLIVLYVGSQLLSTILMSTATDRTQRLIFLALPFVFVIFVINFPAGLLVYWITTNFWTIVQQSIVRKRLGPMRPPSPDGEAPPMSLMDRMLHRGSLGGSGDGAAAKTAPEAVASGARGSGSTPKGSSAPKSRSSAPKSRPASPPPPSPRKKKKRSGRRR